MTTLQRRDRLQYISLPVFPKLVGINSAADVNVATSRSASISFAPDIFMSSFIIWRPSYFLYLAPDYKRIYFSKD
jgi:hypothetical protein